VIFPILVPHGRLAAAQRLLAEHAASRAAEPEEADEGSSEAEAAAEEPDAASDEPAEEAAAAPASWSGLRLAGGIFLLIVGLLGLAYATPVIANRPAPLEWAALAILVVLSVVVCVVGIRVMRVPTEPKA
jgi:uncharacterized membrane protein YcjF (UPF0283 family)